MREARVGIIGGSGLYKMEGLTGIEKVMIDTPFGEPSDAIILGTLEGVRVAFLPRHGEGHRLSPSELPAKANIYALKSLGVERIISVSAVGSLKEDIRPLDIVIPDQLVDVTKGRAGTFFSDGIVGHVSMAEPFCPALSQLSFDASTKAAARVHKRGTYLVVEGPQFSTRAESQLYCSWGVDIVGMTASPEAKLAREAEMCYATLAVVTDYDCWHPGHDSVTVEMILTNLRKGVDTVKKALKLLLPSIPDKRDCACANALKYAIATDPKVVPEVRRKELELLIGKYLARREDVNQA
jgi:5'-methylthioadenosine phosphorylase